MKLLQILRLTVVVAVAFLVACSGSGPTKDSAPSGYLDPDSIEDAVPKGAAAGTRYAAEQMAHLDSER